jgi:hypothetical protein
MEGNINCMHAKLQLLVHPTHLRVVIPSANLVPFGMSPRAILLHFICILETLSHPLVPILNPRKGHTTNLFADWGETGTMENVSISRQLNIKLSLQRQVCFMVDLPRLAHGQFTDSNHLGFFGTELLYFVHSMGLDKSVIDSIRRFDFSRTAHLAFVHSM